MSVEWKELRYVGTYLANASICSLVVSRSENFSLQSTTYDANIGSSGGFHASELRFLFMLLSNGGEFSFEAFAVSSFDGFSSFSLLFLEREKEAVKI